MLQSLRLLIRRGLSRKKPHEVLGVSKDANQKEIKGAYYRLAKIYHPDINQTPKGGGEFPKISEAYQQMLNNIKQPTREQDDQETHEEGEDLQREAAEQDFFSAYEFYSKKNHPRYSPGQQRKDFERFFNEFFTGYYYQNFRQEQAEEDEREEEEYYQDHRGGSRKQQRKLQIRIYLELTPKESKEGASKTINFMRKIICNSCNGEDEFKHEECRRCKGTGLVANNNWISYCSYCNGKGSSRRHTCKTCKGKGKLDIEVEELVTVRPGTNEEDSIRLMGRGNQHLKKGFFGDVVMFIAVLKNTDKLKREGYNTFGEVKVSITEATLGSNVSYSTIWGDKTYKMKAGTQDGVTIRRHGEGYRKKSKGNGDHFLKISVVIPRKISNIETKIYRELQNIEHEVDDLD